MLEEGGGESFYYLRIQFLRFIRSPFHVELSICYPFFRVLLSFTICSNNANLKVAKTRIFMKGNVFPICREKSFSTNQYTTNTLHVTNRKYKKFNLVDMCSCLPKISQIWAIVIRLGKIISLRHDYIPKVDWFFCTSFFGFQFMEIKVA